MGAWVVQLVMLLTLGLGSGLDLTVMSSRPTLGSTLGVKPKKTKKEKEREKKKAHLAQPGFFPQHWCSFLFSKCLYIK